MYDTIVGWYRPPPTKIINNYFEVGTPTYFVINSDSPDCPKKYSLNFQGSCQHHTTRNMGVGGIPGDLPGDA